MIRKPNIILDLDDADFIKVIPLSEQQRKNVELPMQEDPIEGEKYILLIIKNKIKETFC